MTEQSAIEGRLARVSFKVNGSDYSVEVEPRETLLDTVRDKVGLTGAKKGCDEAVCGACSMIVNGVAINSCNMLAVEAEGAEITTIEGIATDPKSNSYDGLDILQKAFIQSDGFQCGFCTSGQIVSAKSFLSELAKEEKESKQKLSVLRKRFYEQPDETIKEALSGNLCRCGCYNAIVDAVKTAASAYLGKE